MRNVSFRNYTGHHMVVESDGLAIFLPTMGRARLDSEMVTDEVVLVADGFSVPVLAVTERKVVGLPNRENGVLYVVSGIVGQYVDRDDCVVPSRVRRNNGGGVDACAAFIRLSRTGE